MLKKPQQIHNNCFDIIRHAAAIMVVFSHHYTLSGKEEPTFLGATSLGFVAVIVFFSISGYLITQSFERRESTLQYAKKRFLRIYPGLAVCLIFTLYICCGIFGKMGPGDWLFSFEPIKTFCRVMLLTGVGVVGIQPDDINGFTSGYYLDNTINGSLWTLFFEIFDYVLLAGFLSVFKNKNLAMLMPLIFSIVVQIYCVEKNIGHLAIKYSSLLSIPFCFGSLMFINKSRWVNNNSYKISLLIIAVAIMIASMFNSLAIAVLCPLAICILTILIGVTIRENLINGRFDFSYGIYIYAFPVQQIVINELGVGFYTSMLLSLAITVVLAALSWFMVEKPMIKIGLPAIKTARIL